MNSDDQSNQPDPISWQPSDKQVPPQTSDLRSLSDGKAATTPLSASLFQRFNFWFLFPAVLLIPLWTALGRILFGVGGWGVFLTIFFVAPVLLAYQLTILVLSLVKDHKNKALALSTSWLLVIYYLCLFVFQLALVDGGDTAESVNSVFTKWLGMSEDVSIVLGEITYYGAIVSGIAIFIDIVRLMVTGRR